MTFLLAGNSDLRPVALVLFIVLVVSSALSEPLRKSADERGFHIGAAVAVPPLRSDSAYRETLQREFNMLVAENAFKMQRVWKGPGQYDFSDTDAIADFAQSAKAKLRGHTLLWYRATPQWLIDGRYSSEEVRVMLEDYITTMVMRYKGRVVAWDVVNEAIDDTSFTLRRDFWLDKLGPDYLAVAFRAAHAADPQAKLFYNEYAAYAMNAKSNAVYELLRSLREQKVPVHGIGWQCHFVSGWKPTDKHRQNAARLAALGLELQITEADFRIPLPVTAHKLREQAESYRSLLQFCLEQPNCNTMVMWGFTDRYSWIPSRMKGFGDGLIFDKDYKPKPAHEAMRKALE